MTSKTIVLTGASDGIGAASARQLAASGHRLILVGRSPEKTRAVAADTGAEWFTADFARLDEVRELAASIAGAVGDTGIHVLANNAG
jgi:short-subunit dehydrogenase